MSGEHERHVGRWERKQRALIEWFPALYEDEEVIDRKRGS